MIEKVLALTERMVEIADEGDALREDVDCGVLYGVLRDDAFKIRMLAEGEREARKRKGRRG
jgi:hypothetical protein